MQIDSNGESFIQSLEGTKLQAYQDIKGVWTIGTGTTVYPNGNRVQQGDTCTQEQANQYFFNDLQRFVNTVNTLVGVPLTQNQFNALVSFVYNVGATAFANSTLLKKLNAGDYQGAKAQFPSWSYSGGQYSQGLNNRRIKEQQLFGAS